jgi:hypothetical protein
MENTQNRLENRGKIGGKKTELNERDIEQLNGIKVMQELWGNIFNKLAGWISDAEEN